MQIQKVNNQPSFRADFKLQEIEPFKGLPKLVSEGQIESLTRFAKECGAPQDTINLRIWRIMPKIHNINDKATVTQTGYVVKGKANIKGWERPIEMNVGSFGDGFPSPAEEIKKIIQNLFK